jgi:hypothetical protein
MTTGSVGSSSEKLGRRLLRIPAITARGDETIQMRLGLLCKPDDLEYSAMTAADGPFGQFGLSQSTARGS